MKTLRNWLVFAAFIFAVPGKAARAQQSQLLAPHTVDLKSADGTLLKATYFPATKPGPGVLLFHQSNRTRTSWNDAARQLAAAGFNTLTVDSRGHGESGKLEKEEQYWKQNWDDDLDAAFQYLVSQPGVARDVIGAGGAGWLGVHNSVETARRHPAAVKSLALLSGETLKPQLRFLHEACGLPELFVVSDDDEYPPTREAMEWLYVTSSSPAKKLIHYSSTHDAPWLWYETDDVSKVAAYGGHGTDLFKTHPDLPGIIVDWFVTTLMKTPGHAPVDALASAAVLNEIEMPGGVARVTRQLTEARSKDPNVQLWPEVNVDIIGEDHMREADAEKKAGHLEEAETDMKVGIEIFKLNLLAYPDSADAHFNLADAYLKDGQKDLARQYAEKALALLDSHAAPLSSWSDTAERRAEIRQSAQQTLAEATK
jgi:dienelactone hydrolase